MQMYTRGLSTRDIEEAFRDPLTRQMLLSHTAVSELTDSLWGGLPGLVPARPVEL